MEHGSKADTLCVGITGCLFSGQRCYHKKPGNTSEELWRDFAAFDSAQADKNLRFSLSSVCCWEKTPTKVAH